MERLLAERRRGLPATPELKTLREMSGKAAERFPRHPDVTIEAVEIAGVQCLSLTPSTVTCELLYFHGGGFRLGSPEIVAGFVSHIAARNNCRAVIPFYSLAPDQPFPAALLEGQAVLESFAGSTMPALIGGDSAGGNIAAVLARRFASVVDAVLLISPWLDLRAEATSYKSNAEKDPVFSEQAAKEASELYLQGYSAIDSDVSPLLGELSAMPPTCIAVGNSEVLIDDSQQFAQKLRESDRFVSLYVIPGMHHVQPTLDPDANCTDQVLDAFADFIANQLRAGYSYSLKTL